MKILHVLNSSKLSGAENVAADICMMFQDRYEMAYCSEDGSIKQALEDRRVHYIPLKKLTYIEAKRILKEYNPDIIHAHDVKATVIASLIAGSRPLVSHLHVNKNDMAKVTIKSILYKLAAKNVKKVIVVSESCFDEYIFKKSINKKTILLKNIIYSRRIERLIDKDVQDYDFDFIFLGRLTYQKNPESIARVASEVLKKIPSVRFGIIGEGELREEMERIFVAEGVSDRAVFTGRLPYPYKAIKQAKCMLMCSRYEGTPIAALEAMSLGVPIVSTPVDGMINLIDDGLTGYLSESESVLAASIINILDDSNKRNELSEETVRKFEKLNNEESYYLSLANLYESLY